MRSNDWLRPAFGKGDMEYTDEQKEYLDSVEGQAHISAIKIIDALCQKVKELEEYIEFVMPG